MTNPAFFQPDWLAHREAADHAARNAALTARAARWLAESPATTHRIVDLGSGTGSNPRYLAPRLPGPQYWHLFDHDAALLDLARTRAPEYTDDAGRTVRLDTHVCDLDAAVSQLPPATSLVTASALIDLVSDSWVKRLAEACQTTDSAVLIVLSVDGEIDFEHKPGAGNEDDSLIRELVGAHQRHDKGMGKALGTAAPEALQRALHNVDYCCWQAPSPWHIGADQARLGCALLQQWAAAATEQAPDSAPRINAWCEARQQHVRDGECAIRVGHRDMFAAPARNY